MESKFWLDRWRQGLTGFHRSEVNQFLQKGLRHAQLKVGATIFVPLCGKSVDLMWLASLGYKVIGVELSPLAIAQFSQEHKVRFDVSEIDNFQLYIADNLQLLCGDFFDLEAKHLESVDLIYDRAALVALPLAMRSQYVSHMHQLVCVDAVTLLVTLDYDQNKMSGPPFSVSDSEVRSYYNEVLLLESNDVLESHQKFKERGVSYLNESCWYLGKIEDKAQ